MNASESVRRLAVPVSWCVVAGAVLLPALSHIGYPFYSMEYIAGLLVCTLAGLLSAWLSRWRCVGAVLLLFFVGNCIVIYFGDMLGANSFILVLTYVVGAAFSVLSFMYLRDALKLAVIFSAAQIIASAATTSPFEFALQQPPGLSSNRPSIVHVLLDEHGGTGAFPAQAVSPEEVKAFENEYVKHGFIVFRHLYTTYGFTHMTVMQLFNFDAKTISAKLPERGQMPAASTLGILGQKRALDIVHTRFLNFSEVLSDNRSVSRERTYDENVIYPVYSRMKLPPDERLEVAAAKLFQWLRIAVHYPPVYWYLRTEEGHQFDTMIEPLFRSNAFTSRLVMLQFIDRMQCCGDDGTYYFVHLLLPHYPYVFDEHCNVLPASRWLLRLTDNRGAHNTIESRLERYKASFAQDRCVASDVFRLEDVIDKKKETANAVIFVHGDHGARIAIDDLKPFTHGEYTKEEHERDWRGTFGAIRIPGVPGRVIDKPVHLIALYRMLVDNDFTAVDMDKLETGDDSPY